MGRPRTVNTDLPRYASAFADRHGRSRIRLRRTGWTTLYVQDEPGTPEFTETYHKWLEGGQVVPSPALHAPGSFDDLIARFYKSKEFARIKPQTRRIYMGELERFRAKYGKRRVSTMTARHIDGLMTKMQATPAAANNLKKRLAQLFDFAARIEMRKDNPAKAVKAFKSSATGYKTWQEEQIAAYQAKWAAGTMQRLCFDLALFTGQRKSDVHRLGPAHNHNGILVFTQIKTGKDMRVPIHPELAASIAAVGGTVAYVETSRGKPFTRNGIGNWFRAACDEAGLQGYSMHGLRKACARRLAELGLSNQLIKSITGHTTDSEVSRYTRDAEQARLAVTAMGLATLSLANQSRNPAIPGEK